MSGLTFPSELISASWLKKHINNERLILLDASYFMSALKRDGKEEWSNETIPGALFFDFDKRICDQTSDLPHMMPTAELFQQEVRALGVNQNSMIVVFDRLGLFSSPRVWWMFKSMGFHDVAVLDGGLENWKDHGFPICAGINKNGDGNFIAHYQADLFRDVQQVLSASKNEQIQILDARATERFLGKVAEPRADLRSGHIPNAKNLPYAELIQDGKMLDVEQLKVIYSTLMDNDKKTIFSCGSGVTACVLALGATLCGYQHLSVYDGSWTQWGADESLPVVK